MNLTGEPEPKWTPVSKVETVELDKKYVGGALPPSEIRLSASVTPEMQNIPPALVR